MKIAILGAGALGCYYGARLAEAGNEVCFIGRSVCDPIKAEGLHVESVHGDIHLSDVNVCRTAEACGPVDLVIVCWKTTCNDQLGNYLPALVHEGTEVLTFQNGMGNAEAISAYVPAERVYIGLCFVCCMMDEPGRIRHLEGGDIQFAPFISSAAGSARAREFAGMFERARIASTAFDHAEQIQWCKLTWNIPFNGLCVAHGGISVKKLFTLPGQDERAEAIMQEVCQAAEMRGFPLRMDIVRWQMERTRVMGDFIPSSAVDYLRGRPVEYDAIWGRTLERAREAGLQAPHWEQLAADIRARLNRA
ncbi:MAG: 2-dehydropantoate 2-reductase [Akkermansia sp.]|nr:2-dehydropantoate 2-reductase [Akkermansia sp.]MBR2313275.1 2-dehydropantoate 2-reductase [Akkermansia sp.]